MKPFKTIAAWSSAAGLSVLLVACEKAPPLPTDTVESLAADPVRLKELRQQCQLDRAKLGDALCNRVGKATTERFLRRGKDPYAPDSGGTSANGTHAQE